MSDCLTREQMEEVCADFEGDYDYAYHVLLKHDAALRQDKADSQTANTALREELEQLRADMRSEQRMSEDLEQQLAASESRVTALEKALTYCAAGPGELHPLNQAQYLVARAALSKENL